MALYYTSGIHRVGCIAMRRPDGSFVGRITFTRPGGQFAEEGFIDLEADDATEEAAQRRAYAQATLEFPPTGHKL